MSDQPTAAETRFIEVTIVRMTPLELLLRLPWLWWQLRPHIQPRPDENRSILAARVAWRVFTAFVRAP